MQHQSLIPSPNKFPYINHLQPSSSETVPIRNTEANTNDSSYAKWFLIRQNKESYDIVCGDNLYNKIVAHSNERNLLIKTIKRLWKTIKYNQEYISWLINAHTDDEFLEISKRFAETPIKNNIDLAELDTHIKTILYIIDENLSATDLAIFTNYDVSEIDKHLSSNYSQSHID